MYSWGFCGVTSGGCCGDFVGMPSASSLLSPLVLAQASDSAGHGGCASWPVVHDAVVGTAGSGAAGAGTVAAKHLWGGPAAQFHQVPFRAAAVQLV